MQAAMYLPPAYVPRECSLSIALGRVEARTSIDAVLLIYHRPAHGVFWMTLSYGLRRQ
jgi:hypothetical protein